MLSIMVSVTDDHLLIIFVKGIHEVLMYSDDGFDTSIKFYGFLCCVSYF
jgi:hypothetical protein